MVREEGKNGPCEGEDGDDEEDENGSRSESVDFCEAVDEPGEHAHNGDLRRNIVSYATREGVRAAMNGAGWNAARAGSNGSRRGSDNVNNKTGG